jgi:hypothetical protein
MMALAMGQYLQDAHALMNRQLMHAPHRLWHWLLHGRVSRCLVFGVYQQHHAINSIMLHNDCAGLVQACFMLRMHMCSCRSMQGACKFGQPAHSEGSYRMQTVVKRLAGKNDACNTAC